MSQLNLKVLQRIAYQVTTKHKHSDAIDDDLLNRNFNPPASNEVWGYDTTYRRTEKGWVYLANPALCA